MVWYNPYTWFERSPKSSEPYLNLYCQAPRCGQQILPGSDVLVLDREVIHPSEFCLISQWKKNSVDGSLQPDCNISPILHSQAQRLAREGKVKYSKLEIVTS